VIRQPDTASAAVGGAHGVDAARHALVSLLERTFGLPEPAMAALHEALGSAGLEELPASVPEVFEFVRMHLLPVLADQMGARAAVAFMTAVSSRFSPRESDMPPSARRPIARVQVRTSPPGGDLRPSQTVAVGGSVDAERGVWLLVEQDSLARASLARSLVQCRCSVRVVDSAADAAAAMESSEPVEVAVVDIQHPAAASIVEGLGRQRPDLVIVARACNAPQAHEALMQLGIRRFGVCARYASAVDLLGVARQLRVTA